MDFGLTIEKLFLIGVIAAFIIGPERLPQAAETFAGFVRRAGEYVRDTRTRMRDELGPEIDEVDWRKLDPRQYDPRRIIRDALLEEPTPTVTAAVAPAAAAPAAASAQVPRAPRMRPEFTRSSPPPFDAEAT